MRAARVIPFLMAALCLVGAQHLRADDVVTFIGASAHNPGVNDTMWVTDLRVFNPDAVREITVGLSFLPAGADNIAVEEVTVTVGPRRAASLDDVVSSLFERAEAGAIRLRSADPFFASSRTYNLGDGQTGTYGQYIEAVGANTALQHGILLLLANDPALTGFRSNVGFVNPTTETATITVSVYDAGSAVLVGTNTLELPPLGYRQVNNVFSFVGAPDAVIPNASVEFASEPAVLAYASVVDNTSGDPIYVRALADDGTPVTMNNPPQSTITSPADDPSIAAGESVFFSGSASDPDGDPVTVLWDFGDGSSSTALEPGDHTYPDAGTYTVTFTATDDQGLADPTPDTRTVTVQGANNAPDGVITQPAGNVTIAAGESVFFSGSASDPDGDPVTVLWDFGDGISSTALEPGNHTYSDAGTYTVIFTATDDQGLADPTPDTRTVTVNQPSVTLSQIQSQTFTPLCVACHGGGNPVADLSLEAGQSHSQLVNVAATTQSGTRVIPFDPDNSVLVIFMEDGHRNLPPAEIQAIRDWITAGAQDN